MKIRIELISVLMLSVAPVLEASPQDDFFESRIRPLLVEHCFQCHRRKAEGGLRLDSREVLLKGGQSGAAIVPGKPQESLLWQVIAGNHAEISMPPEETLSKDQIESIENWIQAGAHWPTAKSPRDEHGITEEERAFWSFQPIANPEPPIIEGAWGAHPIDAFIHAKQQALDIQIAPSAESRTLIRRVTYDLTGLPAAPEDVERFVHSYENSPEASWEKLIEELLASRHYGERWGQHWLDLVRYADTAGDAADFPVPEAYKYRNYVIDAFNADKPYDQFVREQLAGDLMPTEDEDERWERIVATGYIAISRRIGVSPHDERHITLEDTLNNVGKTFLGLSIGCARCHDHKFDPIPTSDYYALYGIFDSTVYPHAGAEHRPYRSDFVYRVGRQEADRILASYRKTAEPVLKEERAAFERYREFQSKPINIPGYNRDVAWKEVLELREQIREIVEQFPDLETAFAASEGQSHDVSIHELGHPHKRGPVARRGFLQILGGQTLPEDTTGSGRLHLAEWITEPENPLTARVIVNRVWHHHFGRGLVATPSDFGVRGERPSHPQLLDYLASYLIEHNWSLKQLHRLILTSKTYQLASTNLTANSATDPSNVYLWRANRRRLDAEQLRDSILEFSGQLDRTMGGRHPVPHRLTYYFRQHEPFVGEFDSKRRSVYLFRQRIRKNEYLNLFDSPDGNLHVGRRRPTTSSLQSLFFMNSEFVAEQSQAIAERLIAENSEQNQRIVGAYHLFYGRNPTRDEMQFLSQKLKQLDDAVESDRTETSVLAWTSLVRSLLSSNEFLYLD